MKKLLKVLAFIVKNVIRLVAGTILLIIALAKVQDIAREQVSYNRNFVAAIQTPAGIEQVIGTHLQFHNGGICFTQLQDSADLCVNSASFLIKSLD